MVKELNMSWLYTWLRDRVFHIPSNMNSGGDLLRRYKSNIFELLDAVRIVYTNFLPDSGTLSDDIVKNLNAPKAVKLALQLFLIGVIDDAYKLADGKIDNVVDYLKQRIETIP